jgi:hypothetical protein
MAIRLARYSSAGGTEAFQMDLDRVVVDLLGSLHPVDVSGIICSRGNDIVDGIDIVGAGRPGPTGT